MRLPYFYQQMLSFLAVILILINVSILSFYHIAYNSALETYEERLFTYADLLVENMSYDDNFSREEMFLKTHQIDFMIIDDQGEVIFPDRVAEADQPIIPKEIESLKKGERFSEIRNTDESTLSLADSMIVSVPFFDKSSGSYGGFVAVSTPLSVISQGVHNLENHLTRSILISTAIAFGISALLSVYQVSRINRLRRGVREVANGNYEIRLNHQNRDELDTLSRDFNKMIIALSKSQKELEKQEELRATFMQDAAHEMRTPLTTINGLLEGMEHGVITGENQKRSVQLMSKETERLIKLVNENLRYENLRADNMLFEKDYIPVKAIFDEISLQMHSLAEKEDNQLVFEDANDLTVYADYDRLKQILVNLVKNAIQFTNGGIINIGAKETKFGTRIFVKDNGIGMTEDQQEKIWERYYKADPSRANTTYGESGLGLSIVLQLVNQHQGLIRVESKLNEGTSFYIDFPKTDNQAESLKKDYFNDIIE